MLPDLDWHDYLWEAKAGQPSIPSSHQHLNRIASSVSLYELRGKAKHLGVRRWKSSRYSLFQGQQKIYEADNSSQLIEE